MWTVHVLPPCIVYPACAGIDLHAIMEPNKGTGLPRMRGDRPPLADMIGDEIKFTPHARGSTFFAPVNLSAQPVYPACAGIDLDEKSYCCECGGLPRMRGDRPSSGSTCFPFWGFTPHARGSTPQKAGPQWFG